MAFFDLTDTLAGGADFRTLKGSSQKGLVVQFYHVPTLKKHRTAFTGGNVSEAIRSLSSAAFKAFLTNFKDNYKVNWSSKETFGRMDAIQTYKNTQRQISISFDVPSHSEEEAGLNFIELQKLIMMQYPTYETIYFSSNNSKGSNSTQNTNADKQILNPSGGHKGRFISSPPLLYVRFLNWITGGDSDNNDKNDLAPNSLVGIITEVNFSPDLEQGFYFDNYGLRTGVLTNSESRSAQGDLAIFPKSFSVDLSITIIHTEELGWVERTIQGQKLPMHIFGEPKLNPTDSGGFVGELFPYKYGIPSGSFNPQNKQQTNTNVAADSISNQGAALPEQNPVRDAFNNLKPQTFDTSPRTETRQISSDAQPISISGPLSDSSVVQEARQQMDEKAAAQTPSKQNVDVSKTMSYQEHVEALERDYYRAIGQSKK